MAVLSLAVLREGKRDNRCVSYGILKESMAGHAPVRRLLVAREAQRRDQRGGRAPLPLRAPFGLPVGDTLRGSFARKRLLTCLHSTVAFSESRIE